MDWMDAYLDGLTDPMYNRSHKALPDSLSWQPKQPTKYQQALIQDAMIADAVRQRMIQEARLAELDAGLYGGYDADSSAKPAPAEEIEWLLFMELE